MNEIKEKLLECVGEFTYMWGWDFFIETEIGNFAWRDPEYGGDNSIRPYGGTYEDFCKACHVPYGRSKGKHAVKNYCGTTFTVVTG